MKMETTAHSHLPMWISYILALVCVAFFVTGVSRDPLCDSNGRATESYRQSRERLRTQLLELTQLLGTLPRLDTPQQIAVMNDVLGVLRGTLLPTFRAEEEVLFAEVERRATGSWGRMTEPMRLEHQIMRRWIEDLQTLADVMIPDPQTFALRGERLLGLIDAHFQIESAVLFPVLDRTMTPAQFEHEIRSRMPQETLVDPGPFVRTGLPR